MTSFAYCTREQVQNALDFKESARNTDQVDRAIYSATHSVEGLLHRSFYPVVATRYFPWPQRAGTSYRLWLEANELISVSTLVSGGTTISSSDYFLEPNEYGPPYDRIELDLSSSAVFGGGETPQRDIAITGVWGFTDDTVAAGTIAEALDSSETGVDVTNSAAIGVGNVIKVESERMIVTGKSMLTTGQTLQTPLTASNADVTVAVTTGSAYSVGEILLLDSERMKIVDISGNSLTVRRAWDGSVLATHTGSTVYAPRTLQVARGALGTTAGAHDTGQNVVVQQVPVLVQQLALAESVNYLIQESGGYSPSTGSGGNVNSLTGGGLDAIRLQAYKQYGRMARMRAV